MTRIVIHMRMYIRLHHQLLVLEDSLLTAKQFFEVGVLKQVNYFAFNQQSSPR
jgi:hypothetical protein